MIHFYLDLYSFLSKLYFCFTKSKNDEDDDVHYQVSCPPTLFISFVLQYLLYDSLSANDVKHAQSYFRGKKFFLCVFHIFFSIGPYHLLCRDKEILYSFKKSYFTSKMSCIVIIIY